MKSEKIIIGIILGFFLFISCSKEEDDLISQNCESGCTEIVGKIMTDNGTVPIPNVKLTLKWDNIPYLGSGTIRNKATTITDSEGNFNLKFFIRDDEINAGGFYVEYEIDENVYLPSHLNKITIFQINRDTTLNINYNIPKKAYLNLTLLNLDNVQSPDWFATGFDYETPDGFTQSVNGLHIGWNNQSDQYNLIEIPGNQNVRLEIFRRVNNITTTEIDTIIIEAGTTFNYTIDFNN